MPQIDAVSYFSIILGSGFFIVSGYLLFNLYGLQPLANIMKLPLQGAGFQQVAYGLNGNHEETSDGAAWLYGVADAFKQITPQEE